MVDEEQIYKGFVFDMPHAKSGCESMEEFVSLHRVQLEHSGIPEHLWNSLFIKLKLEVLIEILIGLR